MDLAEVSILEFKAATILVVLDPTIEYFDFLETNETWFRFSSQALT